MSAIDQGLEARLTRVARDFLGAWNTQDVNAVLACYTADVNYRDPNTRGVIIGAEPMSRYLRKLFANWQMHWELRDLYPLDSPDATNNREGAVVRWTATLRRADRDKEVQVDGMDLVLLRDGSIAVNEVQFDRAALVPLLS